VKRTLVEWAPRGRELGAEPLPDTPAPWRIVACLNVWNDRPALEQTLRAWWESVDHVIAVDGAYASAGGGLSTDGTREFLLGLGRKVQLLDEAGTTQFAKRNRYIEAGRPGDLLFVIDADEAVRNGGILRQLPELDVGWVRIESPMYRNAYGQPRLFRWTQGLEYRGRHHWIYRGDRLLAAHQYAGPGFDQRTVNLTLENRRGLGHSSARAQAKVNHSGLQLKVEAPAVAMPSSRRSDLAIGARESLRILQLGLYDAGLASSRLHSAINRTTPHASLWFKEQPGPFGVAGQYSTTADGLILRRAAGEADVVHFHLSPFKLPARTTAVQKVVMHHHGSILRKDPAKLRREAKSRGALVILSNLELLTYAPDGRFLPNPVPVARYRRLRELVGGADWDGSSPFRIAHSPSKPHRKGSEDLDLAVARLNARNRGKFHVELLTTTGVDHAEALKVKASCHACFDSFWLGMQCSGLEAAAMGLPVVAGDKTVADRYRERHGYVPYTFADSAEELEAQLERLITDADFRQAEASRTAAHVLEFHDDAAVALAYLDLLDEAFGWRNG
jgi:hypothetical protein